MDKTEQEMTTPPIFTEIGKGTFGTIFTEATCPCRILKRTLRPNIDPQNWLEQDAHRHELIYQPFQAQLQNHPILAYPTSLNVMVSSHATATGGAKTQGMDERSPGSIAPVVRRPRTRTTSTKKSLCHYLLRSESRPSARKPAEQSLRHTSLTALKESRSDA